METAQELLNDPAIRAYLHRLVGDEGLDLIERFPVGGEYSDEDLAAKTGINLNSVRHSLYTLYERRLAEYHRIKNNETGWLTYLWQLRLDNIYTAIREDMTTVLEKLEKRERYEEENDFYICKECQNLYTFPQAMNIDFNCTDCGKPLTHFDNELLLKSLKYRIQAIKKALGGVS
jgi:transcription initiation factor TFIIE subunit alpha